MSPIRKKYIFRLIFRILVLLICTITCFTAPETFDILNGMNFFRWLSPLHLLWIIWVTDMFQQIIPVKSKLPLGSMKLFSNRFRPLRDKINYQALRDYIITTTRAAYKVFLIWTALILAIGLLHYVRVINDMWLFMISVIFYVCDLICVLIWCPFRLIMKNRCCTTCRIFNWDHLMMFTPLIYMRSFYAWSLVILAFLAWLVWELCIMMYPERFWHQTNVALKCSECTDKLCTQYCQKIRH